MTLGGLLRAAAERLGLAAAGREVPGREVRTVRGLRVVVENTRADVATADVLDRLDEALGLVERYQPWRLAHLRRDVREVRVVRFACRGAFFPAERAVVTELTFLARRDITAATVAASVVHEGVHARVHAMAERFGWRGAGARYAEDLAREERLCRRAEVAFGRALPGGLGEPVVARAEGMLGLADEEVAPVVDWRLAEARVRGVDGTA